jgi:hypothetical protein
LFRLALVFVFYVLFVVKSLPNLSVHEAGGIGIILPGTWGVAD